MTKSKVPEFKDEDTCPAMGALVDRSKVKISEIPIQCLYNPEMEEVRRYKGDEKLKSFLYECPPVEFDVRKIVGTE